MQGIAAPVMTPNWLHEGSAAEKWHSLKIERMQAQRLDLQKNVAPKNIGNRQLREK